MKKQINHPSPISPKGRRLGAILIAVVFTANCFSQNISINTTGAANTTLSMLEVLQISATANTKGLHIAHSGLVAGTGYGAWIEKTGASTTNVAGYFSASGGTNNYAIIVPSGGGSVGIGTTSPSYLLDIQGTGNVQTQVYSTSATGIANMNIRTSSTGAFDYAGIALTNDVNFPATRIQTYTSAGGNEFRILHYPNAPITLFTNNAERMRITGAGNVGINTTTPNTLFDVNGSVAHREGTALALVNGANNDIAIGGFAYFRITGPTAAFTVSGFTGGADGRIVTLYNTTSQIMTIANNTTSIAANQILTITGANIVTPAGPNVIQLQYNANVSRWLVIGGQNLAGNTTTSTNSHCFTCDGF